MVSDFTSDSVSLTSDDYIFRQRGGRAYTPARPRKLPFSPPPRRYHAFADNPYPVPADEREGVRLDSWHDISQVLYHKNVLAPIKDLPLTQIVDLGTGSGLAYVDHRKS